MRRFPFTKSMQESYKEIYNPELIIQEIEREIEEKGFSIFKVDEQKRLEFFYHFSKRYLLQKPIAEKSIYYIQKTLGYIASISFLFLLIVHFYKQEYTTYFLFFFIVCFACYTIGIIMYMIYSKFFGIIGNNKKLSSIPGIKEPYIFITDTHIFLKNKFLELPKGGIRESETIYNEIFTPSNYFYEEEKTFEGIKKLYEINSLNRTQENITRLTHSLNNLEVYIHEIQKKYLDIKTELLAIQKGSFDFSHTQESISELQKMIKQSLKKQKQSLNIMKKIAFVTHIDFSKFQQYLHEKLIFSLKSSQYILKNHIFVINELEKQNKHLDSKYIELANKRLEIYKNQLTNHVELLEQEIEKLQ